ncbi:ICEA protein [Natranaerovirga pectinivora]|uniref:ICEA protein n=1 Tax=Natranaerovirga pectinivora TaxID=682400 RepID=A0A4V2V0J2_9FIRM|nr:hypothetical protein [Natranaerovirga pectinivora]TCT16307.1 ICEA protein [Natranaerovirga pectinivora]
MNPFKEGTTSHYDFEIMKDLKWHCTKCELRSGQAKTWQIWRQEKGLQLDKDEKDNWFNKIHCENCDQTTVHRKLRSLEINDGTKARSGIPGKLAKKIKEYYGCIDAYSLRKEVPTKLEIDHRKPQVRWDNDEDINDVNMSNGVIEERFMLLTRENNLLKSRKCEKCNQTGERQTGYNIDFFYMGTKVYEEHIGCEGCFWFNPDKWREAINNIVKDYRG